MDVRKIILFTCFSILLLYGVKAQNIVWEKVIPFSSDIEVFNSMDITNDKKIIAAGNINGDTTYISKFDTNGTVIWFKTGYFGSGSGDRFVKQLKSGNIIYTTDFNNKGILQKLNVFGDTIPHWEYGDTGNTTILFETLELAGGKLASAGYTGSGYFNFALLKIDTLGNLIWLKEYPYGSIGNDESVELILNRRGNFVLGGDSYSHVTGYDTYHRKIMEINPDGDTIRTKLIVIKSNKNNEQIPLQGSLIETYNEQYILCTAIDTLNSSNQPVGTLSAITLLDTNFNIIWNTFLPGIKIVSVKAKQLSDSTFIVLGMDGVNKIYLYYLNKNGTITNSKIVTSTACSNNLTIEDFKFLADSSIVAVGACWENPYNSYIVKINKAGGTEYIPHDTCQSFTTSFSAQQTGDSIYFFNTSNGGYDYAKQSVWKFADSTSTNIFNAKIYVTGAIDSVWARLTATNGYGCTGTVSKKVKVSQVTAINQNAVSYSSLAVTVFPNPFTETTGFKINNNSNSSYQLSILNSLGEEISSYNFSGKEFTLNASGFSSGLYMYVLRDTEGKMKSGKLVVE